jgi:hypothetical protein
MVSLLRTLQDAEPALLPILAAQWGVRIDPKDRETAVKRLAQAMLDPMRAEQMWEKLDDAQRGAIQVLISGQGKMAETMFSRLFGEIRRMGAGQIDRERPHEQPGGTAEALYYRGLISIAFEPADTGARSIVYVPEDLLAALPLHRTSYDNLVAAEDILPDDEDDAVTLTARPQPDQIRPADTSIVDDLTTLLAYVQLFAPAMEDDSVADAANLLLHLLSRDEVRLVFLIGLAASKALIETQSGRLYVQRTEARRWLAASRSDQVRELAAAWRGSSVYHDLWHVPGLVVDRVAGSMPQYNPAAPRESVVDLLANAAPGSEWWSQGDFIKAMKLHERDFQRPNGDYESWYIHDLKGDYLSGEQSWDAVDGALLHYYLNGPLHWLGLLDVADDAARLTAYGRAFVAGHGWPAPADVPEKITVKGDGLFLVPRKAARIDRFQIARFSTWVEAGDPYVYRLDGSSIDRAAEQGINVSHIASFISKLLGDAPLPDGIARLLENWRGGATAVVTLERLLVLRTTAAETLDFLYETPHLRRFFAARLGPLAAVVRADQWPALQTALGEHGITVELIGL